MKVKITLVILLHLFISACVYRMDVQQGNLLKLETLDRVEVGMTKSQIKYLLGGPLVGTPFEENRWDYIYYYQPGNKTDTQRYCSNNDYGISGNYETSARCCRLYILPVYILYHCRISLLNFNNCF